jgi:hypothetical protein
MKLSFFKLIIILQLFSMGVELVDAIFIGIESGIELTEKETEKEFEKEDEDLKDKIIVNPINHPGISISKSHFYLEFSSHLTKTHLSRLELPPELI